MTIYHPKNATDMNDDQKQAGQQNTDDPAVSVLSVMQLLQMSDLIIPPYQRPYKWTHHNVAQLWSDLLTHKGKPGNYRLGTVVLHKDKNNLNIVDGQQRILTLLLLVEALLEMSSQADKTLKWLSDKAVEPILDKLEKEERFKPTFSASTSAISKHNLQHNYEDISRRLQQPGSDSELVNFALVRCEFVTVTLTDISEAFQFFDSQNTRGKALKPHDLLKAYHLRQFGSDDLSLKKNTVARWENTEEDELAHLFNAFLYRIRSWNRGHNAGHFTKDDLALFKGLDLTQNTKPLTRIWQMAHLQTSRYNASSQYLPNNQTSPFPHQLDQPIINGRYFFEWVAHYQQWGMHLPANTGTDSKNLLEKALTAQAGAGNTRSLELLHSLSQYPGHWRTGDGYVRSLFDCLLMCYLDRFGNERLAEAVEKAFVWAYALRLNSARVSKSSMNNHVRSKNLFMRLRDMTSPQDFLNYTLPSVPDTKKTELANGLSSSDKSVWEWFEDLGYIRAEKQHG